MFEMIEYVRHCSKVGSVAPWLGCLEEYWTDSSQDRGIIGSRLRFV
jgi:hypothetical protein